MIRRRRECLACSWRHTTYERSDTSELVVIKSDGKTRERFDTEKIRRGILAATENLDVDSKELDMFISEIVSDLRPSGNQVHSKQIGQMVEQRLLVLNPVAFVRFASVFRRFSRPEEFAELARTFEGLTVVLKRDGRLQLFDPEKVRIGIEWAAKHTALRAQDVDRISEAVVAKAMQRGDPIPSQEIGEVVLEHLRRGSSSVLAILKCIRTLRSSESLYRNAQLH